jgi:hypothetical protein
MDNRENNNSEQNQINKLENEPEKSFTEEVNILTDEEEETDVKDTIKSSVWIYAVALFTCAFVVLLITAYSQIKFNGNIEQYQAQISSNEKEKNKVVVDLNSALKNNEELNKENTKLKEDNSKIKSELSDFRKDYIDNKGKNTEAFNNYEKVLLVIYEYNNAHIEKSALLLKYNVDYDLLGDMGKRQFDELQKKTFTKASKLVYQEALSSYNLSDFDNSKIKFKQSYELDSKQNFSDDCLYYWAMCEYKKNNKAESISIFDKMISEFNGSSLVNDAKKMKEKISQENG